MNPWHPCKNKEEVERLFRLTPAASSALSIQAMIEVGWTIPALLERKFIEAMPAQPACPQQEPYMVLESGEPWKDPADMAKFQKHLLHQIASVFNGQQSHLNSTHQRLAAKLRASRERPVHRGRYNRRGYHRQHEPRRWLAVCVVLFLVLMVLGCLPH